MYESGENYLETILRLKEEKGTVHSIDVAHKLSVSKPSVSRAVSILKRDGYLEQNEGTELILTQKGFDKASDIYARHKLLTEFLVVITGVPEDQAEENACRIEHDIDADVAAGIGKWMKKNRKSC